MATDRSQPVVVTQDFGNAQRIKNLPNAVDNQEPVTLAQLVAQLLLKQDVVSGGAGIILDGSTIEVDLATAGSDYSGFSLTNTDFASLNGTYTRLNYRAWLTYAGTNLTLKYGGDFNAYYKDNGNGIWAVVMRREIDGDAATSDSGNWLAALTTVDPTTVTADVSSFVPDYQAVDYDWAGNADVLDEVGNRSPAEGYSLVDLVYGVGSTPAGLKFDNNKLALDFANTTGDAASTKVFPSSVVKTYIDEQVSDAKDLANHPFSNAIAQIAGNPTNAQSAFEALAAENNTQDSQISAIQTVNTTQTSQLTALASAVGVALGTSSLPVITGGGVGFVGGTDSATRFQSVADSILGIYQNMGTINGLNAFETDFGTGFVILPNNSSAKALFQATEAELQALSLGLGQFWAPVDVHNDTNIDITNPGTDTFGGAVAAQGERVLLMGQTDASENGIYIFDTTSTAMVRATDADADAEYTPNKTVQVLRSTEEGISGATFAYSGDADPVVGTDDLTFVLKSEGVVGDNTITEDKLGAALADKVNDKTDKYVETVTTDASGYVTVTHTLGSADFIAQVWTTTGTVEVVAAEISDPTINSVVIGGVPSTTYKVVLIG